jgi:hypothetical protein
MERILWREGSACQVKSPVKLLVVAAQLRHLRELKRRDANANLSER